MTENPFAEPPEPNPYATPLEATPVGSGGNPLLAPAICLLVLTLLYLLVNLAALPRQIGDIAREDLSTPAGQGKAMGQGGFVVVMFLLQFVLLYGSVCMIRLKSYGVAMSAAIVALIPICSPCFVLGIPFGVWALIVLRRPEVKARFGG